MTGFGRTPRTLALAALGAILLIGVAAAGSNAAPAQDGAIYEIRNYHFDPARFDEYAEVAKGEYIRYLREHLDIVGFWIESGTPAEVRGAEQDELGPANVTWVIRWTSKEERDEKLPEVLGTPEWREIFAEVPGGGVSYLRIESRFMSSLD
ncbi:MAG: hypothetical protein F4Z33_07235 [Gemmatimonadales bacterium]|nr:hypothetical protein [Gemmatimonadales bacterium]MYC89248.1 hypothetical protein [Candidatus Palauibacter denitrificans]